MVWYPYKLSKRWTCCECGLEQYFLAITFIPYFLLRGLNDSLRNKQCFQLNVSCSLSQSKAETLAQRPTESILCLGRLAYRLQYTLN